MKEIIRSIRIGDVFAGKLINVGHEHKIGNKDLVVTDIIHDLDFLKGFGIDKYDVYVKDKMGWGTKILWQSFQRQPVSVTYECAK